MKLKDVTKVINMNIGFYIVYKKNNGAKVEMYFADIFDCYDRLDKTDFFKKRVLVIGVLKNRLAIYI